MTIIIRKENPPKYNNYRKYKKYLRKDFNYNCIYCTIYEWESGSFQNFSCEHFKPKSRIEFRHLKNVYENLYYACNVCNRFKADTWPSEEMIKKGFFFLDPCEVDYDDHFEINENTFELICKSNAAVYMNEKIHLNRKHLIKIRNVRYLQQELKNEMHNLCEISNNSSGLIKNIMAKIIEKYHQLEQMEYVPLSEEDMR